jgi:hypothetical protein
MFRRFGRQICGWGGAFGLKEQISVGGAGKRLREFL